METQWIFHKDNHTFKWLWSHSLYQGSHNFEKVSDFFLCNTTSRMQSYFPQGKLSFIPVFVLKGFWLQTYNFIKPEKESFPWSECKQCSLVGCHITISSLFLLHQKRNFACWIGRVQLRSNAPKKFNHSRHGNFCNQKVKNRKKVTFGKTFSIACTEFPTKSGSQSGWTFPRQTSASENANRG